jgi:hypothetical protein
VRKNACDISYGLYLLALFAASKQLMSLKKYYAAHIYAA